MKRCVAVVTLVLHCLNGLCACSEDTLLKLVAAPQGFSAAQVIQLCQMVGTEGAGDAGKRDASGANPAPKQALAAQDPAQPKAAPAAAPSAQTSASAPTSQNDWRGDRITLNAPTNNAFKEAAGGATVAGCEQDSLYVTKDGGGTNNALTLVARSRTAAANTGCLVPGKTYTANKSDIEASRFLRQGWIYGGLVVPFKFHLKDHAFTGSSTIGPYLGFQWTGDMGAIALIGSAGVASLSQDQLVANTTGSGGSSSTTTTTKTNNLMGYSLAAGTVFTVSKGTGMHVGALVGWDWAGSNASVPYKYEGKPWLALEIGYPFN